MLKVTRDGGLCHACWQRDPDRPFVYVAGLTGRLVDPPVWLEDFAAYAAARFCPSRACGLLRELGRLHAAGATTPAALLDAARWEGRSVGPLARTLESFFVQQRLALRTDHEEELARGRRARRLAAVPPALHPTVLAFVEHQLRARERARRAGTRPRSHHTIESDLDVVRDLARFVIELRLGLTGWESISISDLEQFLARRPGSRARSLTSLRTFFGWARRQRLVLVNPTRGLQSSPKRGFTGPVVDLDQQRRLLRRWTSTEPHPHAALVGLLSMLHAASAAELRGLRLEDVDYRSRAVRLGDRPRPVPLDPASWAALTRCLEHRKQQATINPHLLVTKITATRDTPASQAYVSHVLDPAGTSPRHLRSNRLADMVATGDPLMVISALGLTPAAATWYLADTVDDSRLAEV